MAKAINVKVARTKVIKALEVKVEEMKNQQMNYELLVSKHETDYADWKNQVAQIAYSNLDSVKISKRLSLLEMLGTMTTMSELILKLKSLKTKYQQNQKCQKILSKQVDMVATILVASRTDLQKYKMQFVF